MNNYALITGASSGIGRELALLMAEKGHALVLVARRAAQLNELAQTISERYKTPVHILPKDLIQATAADEIFTETNALGFQIDILINNAGFGDYGWYVNTDPEKELQMMQLNMVVLTRLTKLYLPSMAARRSGRILNIASVSAFMPGPLMTVYYATKAFVLSYSEGLSEELRGTGVNVTVFCCGAVDTGFVEAAKLEKSGLFKKQKIAKAAIVAKNAYTSMMKGKVVAINGLSFRISMPILNFLPRPMIRKIVMWMQKEG